VVALLVVSGVSEIQYNGVFYPLSGGAVGTVLPDEVIVFAMRKHADKMAVYKGAVPDKDKGK
jgi:hypothetical protein